MSFFDSILGKSGSDDSDSFPWIPLHSSGQIDQITRRSAEIPVAIFKHSTRCGISRMVLRGFEKEFDVESSVELYFLDLLKHRELSNAIADTFGVTHQSPQLLLIKNGKAVRDWSHGDIDAQTVREAL